MKGHRRTFRRNKPPDHCLNPEAQGGVSRRDFLRVGTAAALGVATGALWLPAPLRASTDDTSRVVLVTDLNLTTGSTVNSDIARLMIDAGITALTDAPTPEEAWLCLFPELAADLSMGIKINAINYELPVHPEITLPLAESLSAVPVGGSNYPINQVVVWDRYDGELLAAGYSLNTSTTGLRCFGTDHPGVGYHSDILNVNGSVQHPSRCYTDYSDSLINLSTLKNHSFAGVSHSLKNHYGSIDDPESMHDNYCRYFIPALNSALFSTYGEKQKLCVCDAAFGIFSGGPMGPPQFIYNGILLAQDPVALDAICRTILEEYNCNTLWMSDHIDIASQEPYNLGNSALEDIELVHIENPSAVGNHPSVRPTGASLEGNYPEPFNAQTSIPLLLDRPGSISVVVVNLQGKKVRTLHQGSLSAGRHTLTWCADDDNGRPVASGKYIVRLTEGEKTTSRLITFIP